MKTSLKAFFFVFFFWIGTSSAFADNVKEGNRLYDEGKYHEALTCFMKQDAVNNPATLNRIGYMYAKGRGVS